MARPGINALFPRQSHYLHILLGSIALAIAIGVSAQTLTFPPPASPETAVSTVVPGPAGTVRPRVFAASDGDVTLAVWLDTRAGTWDVRQVYAARIDANGRVLDPLGIPVSVGTEPEDVVWDGQAFVIVTGTSYPPQELVRISRDGVLLNRRALGFPYGTQYIAASGSGAGTRFLFRTFEQTAQGSVARVAVVSTAGDITAGTAIVGGAITAASASGSDFLVLHSDVPQTLFASRIDANGRLVTKNDVRLKLDTYATSLPGSSALAGNGHGFLLVNTDQRNHQPVTVGWWLDEYGVATTGKEVMITAPTDGLTSIPYPPTVIWDGRQYVVAWHVNRQSGGSELFAAQITPGADSAAASLIGSVTETTFDLALVRGLSAPFLFFCAWETSDVTSPIDLFVQRFTFAASVEAPKVVAVSGARQKTVRVATTGDTYAVAWLESQHGDLRLMVRRFFLSGSPFDPQPMEVARFEYWLVDHLFFDIAATATRYAVVWGVYMGDWSTSIRRLSDRSGEWLDAGAVPLMNAEVALASNGTDLLAFGGVRVSSAVCCVAQTQRIPMSGGAPLPPVVVGTAAAEISTPAVASNGIDYLAVWAQPPHCVVDPCYVTEMPLKAQRLRADGTAIDPLPIEVQGGAGRSAWEPSVAWNGGRYVAVWGEHSTTSLDIHAASITPEGAVGDLDASGHGVIVATGRGAAKIMPFLNGFALVTWGGGPPTEGTAFCGTCDLKTVPSLPRTTLFDNSGVSQNSIDVAGTGGTIIAAYTRREPAAGYVDRAFARSYVWIPARRRAAVH